MPSRGLNLAVVAAVAAALAFSAEAVAAPAVAGEFALPAGETIGSNNEIVQGPDGNMWVTTETNTVVRITPAGATQAFAVPNTAFGITVGPDNNLWASTTIGVLKITPANPPVVTPFVSIGLNNGAGITAGPDGRMWVAGDNELISFSPADPDNTEDENPVPGGLSPKGMATGSDGLLWVADAGGNRVISATAAAAPVFTPYDVSVGGMGGPQDVAGGPSGQVGYVNPTSDPQSVGRITPGGTPQITQLTPSDPFGLTFGQDGAYWVARSNTNDLLRLTPDGQTTTLSGFAPSGGVGPRKIATGPGNTLWVTLDTPEKVARVTGVEAPAPPPPPPPGGEPTTEVGKTPKKKVKTSKRKAKVKFGFSSATAGTTFECSLEKKGKPTDFEACASPATYKVKPGKYSFAVRAVLGGIADATPATYGFKVVRQQRN